uniref:Amino acid adenylation domain n=1 Tax=Marinomonas sp. (strain MWYL1) TaxID=400668 RepID=A6VYF8_MARMS
MMSEKITQVEISSLLRSYVINKAVDLDTIKNRINCLVENYFEFNSGKFQVTEYVEHAELVSMFQNQTVDCLIVLKEEQNGKTTSVSVSINLDVIGIRTVESIIVNSITMKNDMSELLHDDSTVTSMMGLDELSAFPLDYNNNVKGDQKYSLRERYVTLDNEGLIDKSYLLTALKVFFHKYFNHTDLTMFILDSKSSTGLDQYKPLKCSLDSERTFQSVIQNFENYSAEIKSIRYTSELDFSRQVLVDCCMEGDETLRQDNEQLEISSPFLLEIRVRKLQDASLQISYLYNSSLISHSSIKCLFASFEYFLDRIVNNSSSVISEIEIACDETKKKLIGEWGDNVRVKHSSSVIDVFEHIVETSPDSTAIIEGEKQYTYQELNKAADIIALHLRAIGVKKGGVVPLYLNRGFSAIASMLALSKCGVAFSPLDVNLPKAKMFETLKILDALFVITDDAGISKLPMMPIDYYSVEDMLSNTETSNLSQVLDENQKCVGQFDSSVSGDEIFYVMCTSGTTGRPKAVAVESRSVVRLVVGNRALPLSKETKLLNVSSLSFDASVLEIWGALLNGAQLVVMGDALFDFSRMEHLITEHQVNTLWLTSALFDQWSDNAPTSMECLKHLIVGGDRVNPISVVSFYEKFKDVDIYNGYGPTENTTFSTMFKIPRSTQVTDTSIPIGYPIEQSTVYILDRNQKVLPIGGIGEIYVGGHGVAKGYLNDTVKSDEKFIFDYFKPDSVTGRLYRTGDYGRWKPEGYIDYIARSDGQVKIRGFRIELGEIESTIVKSGFARLATVQKIEDESVGSYLAAYFTPLKNSIDNLSDKIRDHLKECLPEYMVPLHIVELEEIPVNVNGKLSKKDLPHPNKCIDLQNHIAPVTDIEKKVCSVISDVLKITNVGLENNFFLIGGNSILAATLIKKINNGFGTRLPVDVIFDNQVVADLCRLVEQSQPLSAGRGEQINSSIEPAMSIQQKRLWFIDKLEDGAPAYNIPITLKFNDKVNIRALEYTLANIVHRHESLRMRFMKDSEDVIVGEENQSIPIEKICIDGLNEGLLQEVLNNQYFKEISKPFDLSQPCKIRAKVISLEDFYDVLVITIPHIVFDGESVDLFTNEFVSHYHNYFDGGAEELPELECNYRHFVEWQKNNVEDGLFKQNVEKLKNSLKNAPSVHRLPADSPRYSDDSDYAGNTIIYEIDKNLSSTFKEFCKENEISIFMGFLSLYSMLISRYSNEPEVVISSPISNRPDSKFDNIIGLFINTIVYRVSVENSNDLTQFLERVKQVCIDSYKNKDVPFEVLVDALQPERILSRNPVSQLMINYYEVEDFTDRLGEIGCETIKLQYPFSKYDLALNVVSTGDKLSLNWNYSTHLFSEETVRGFISSFVCMMECVCRNKDLTVAEVEMLSSSASEQIISEFSGGECSFNSDINLMQRFEKTVNNFPEKIALQCGNTSINYKELNYSSNKVARLLLERGVNKGDLVGISMSRSIDLVVGIIGIMKAGAAYVPIDPDYPASRINEILQDSALSTLLTDVPRPAFASELLDVINIGDDDIKSRLNGLLNDNISHEHVCIRGEDLAYVIYTSGTTGKPKGVMQTHKNIERLFEATNTDFNFSERDTWILFHSCAFDFSVWEMWGALVYGGKLVIPNYEETRDAEKFFNLCRDSGVTVLNQTPTAFYELSSFALKRNKLDKLDKLQWIIFGGEALKPELLTPWWKSYTDSKPQLVNMYGITETTVHVTLKLLKSSDVLVRSNIGKPLKDVKAYVLDDLGRPVPPRVPGELFIGGAGIARGYLNDAELTTARFVSASSINFKALADDQARLYKTGDMVRWLVDGNLEYVGRKDNQVKIRGFRIEIGDVENALSAIDGVNHCAVIVSDTHSHKSLVGYYVSETEKELSSTAIRRVMLEKLPEHMVPSLLINLETMPVTNNGKLDKKALPEPTPLINRKEYIAPRNFVESEICSLWEACLDVENVGIRDNFFELGGDSILSIRVISEMREKGLELSVKDLFRYQTIENILNNIEVSELSINDKYTAFSLVSPEVLDSISDIDLSSVEDIYPASFLQTGMLFESEMATNKVYHNVARYRVGSTFNLELFTSVWTALVKKHPLMRSAFTQRGFDQCLLVQYRDIDINSKIEIEQEKEFSKLLDIELSRGIDIEEPGLFRIIVLNRDESSFELVVSVHHAIEDGWSLASLLAEFCEAYINKVAVDTEKELPLYSAFVAQEKDCIENQAFSQFWSEYLRDFKKSSDSFLLSDVCYGQTDQMIVERRNIDDSIIAEISGIASKFDVPIDSVLFAVYVYLLSTFYNRDDVVTGLVVNNRLEVKGGEQAFGLFLNTLPVRIDVSGYLEDQLDSNSEGNIPKVFEFIKNVHAEKIKLMGYKQYPYGKIKSDTGSSGDIFHSAFNYVNFHVSEKYRSNGAFEYLNGYEKTNIPLVFNINRSENDFEILLKGHSGFIDSNTAARLVEYFLDYLYQLVTLNALSSRIPESEYNKQLMELSGENLNREPSFETLHEILDSRAHLNPDKIAIKCGDNSLTYGELNQKSSRLACYIQSEYRKATGAMLSSDVPIPVCIDRGLDMVVTIFGVLKSGAAYVPIDPDYPIERVEFILSEVESPFFITNSCLDKLCSVNTSATPLFLDLSDYESSPEAYLEDISCSHDLAYIIYTSGSTGSPKGVMIEHRSVCAMLESTSQYLDFSKNDKWLSFHSYAFDFSVWEIFGALFNGATAVIAEVEVIQNPVALRNLMLTEGISILSMTPSAFNNTIVDSNDLSQLSTVRHVVFGGEKLNCDGLRNWYLRNQETLSNTDFINMYGITEITVHATFYRLLFDKEFGSTSVIGRPLKGLKAYVLNDEMSPVPIGVKGKLYISGYGLARGYLNKQTLTEESFIDYTFLNGETRRLYDTGDIVRWNDSGELEYFGRKDKQLSIRGFRIEIGEIEANLRRSALVRDTQLVAREDSEGNTYISAFVIPLLDGRQALDREKQNELIRQIKSELRLYLPEYMIPTTWALVSDWPLTTNGKIDTERLIQQVLDYRTEYVEPRNELEEKIQLIWEDVFNRPRICVDANFFELGGTSLNIMSLSLRLHTEFGVEIGYKSLFGLQTIIDQARYVESEIDKTRNKVEIMI